MRRTGNAAAVATLIIVATASVAGAASRPAKVPPVCNLIVDPAGNVKSGDQSLDIVSADIAADVNNVTVVFRVAKLTPVTADVMSPTGRYYAFAWSYEGQGGRIAVQDAPTGTSWSGGAGRGVLDYAKNEIRMTVPVANLVGHPVFKPGAALSQLAAYSDHGLPAGPPGVLTTELPLTAYQDGNSASSTKIYPIAAPSCVKVGV
jgi:hypothetical protein